MHIPILCKSVWSSFHNSAVLTTKSGKRSGPSCVRGSSEMMRLVLWEFSVTSLSTLVVFSPLYDCCLGRVLDPILCCFSCFAAIVVAVVGLAAQESDTGAERKGSESEANHRRSRRRGATMTRIKRRMQPASKTRVLTAINRTRVPENSAAALLLV